MNNTEKTINKWKNKAECMSTVNSYINKIIPELKKELEKGYKITVNNQFHKKDKGRFDKIIVDNFVNGVRSHIQINDYSITLNTDKYYSVGEFTVNYYKQHVYLVNRQDYKQYDFEPLKEVITEKELLDAKAELTRLENEKLELNSKISRLNMLLND